jgi:hypothetical protein
MRERLRHVLPIAIAAAMVVTIFPATTLAQEDERTITPAGLNADKVDGKHAVGYTNNRRLRRNKLVATNRRGFLPSNIVQPFWAYIQNMPPGFADGVDDVGYTTFVGACGGIGAAPGTVYVVFNDLPRAVQYQFMVVPTVGTAYLTVEQVEYQMAEGGEPVGTLDIWVRVKNFAGGAGDCNVRGIAFDNGIMTAGAKRALKNVKSITRKSH